MLRTPTCTPTSPPVRSGAWRSASDRSPSTASSCAPSWSPCSSGVCYTENQSSATQPRLSYAEMTEDYPRYPDIHDLDLALLNPRMIVDVTPYMNPSPYTVSPNTHISQVFNLFRTMGLRHLPVVNAVGEIVGIITRHNLTHEFLVAKLRQHSISV
ncbi:chloride transport protein 6-like [Gymnodraco acuticeps]|uniref:H(+)/Cl(-) exchange transporter 6 n=1 Tax=Gymnodraco acuticeps TaxID=8218 RepID=A0A6P8T340_GYMAC|nr:chloride transport protein 6-like [Gymnodraco acuticeps]